MSEGLGAFKISLGLDSAQATTSLVDLNRKLKGVKSEFDAVHDGTKDFAQSADGLKAKNEMLTRQFGLQEAKLKELKKRYDDSVKAKGKDDKASENLLIQYNKTKNAMNKTERQIKDVEKALKDQTSRAKKAQEGLEKFGDKSKDVGGKLSSSLTPLIGGLGTALGKVADDADSSRQRLQQYFGSTKEEAEKLTQTARDIWKDGFGEDMGAVEDGIIQVKQNMKDLNESDLEQVTRDAMTLAGVFDADVNEVTRAGNNLMQGFGETSEEAFDLMAWGAQNGLNFSNEMFDNLAEYAPLYKDMGFSAEEYFELLKKGTDSGVYNLDYINDVMKEFQIRTKDGTEGVAEAIGQLSPTTQGVFEDFKNGEATIKDLHNSAIKDLSGMEDQVEANQIGVELYGTKWEDLEQDSMYAMGNITGELENVDGAMANSGENVDKSFGHKLKVAFRTAQEDLVPLGEKLLAVGEDILPKITDGVSSMVDWWNDLSPKTQDFALKLGAVTAAAGPLLVAVGSIAGVIGGLVPIVSGVIGSIAGAGGLGAAIAGLATGPIGITVAAIGGLVAGGVLLWKNWDKLNEKIGPLATNILALATPFGGVVAAVKGFKEANEEVIPSMDLFNDKVSDSTQKAVGDYMKMDEDATLALNEMAWSQSEITKDMAEDLIGQYDEMNNTILTKMDERHEEELGKTKKLFEDSSALSAEEEAKILEDMDKKHATRKEKQQEYEDQIAEIVNTASNEKRALTESERIEIEGIQDKMKESAVKTMSESEEEQMIILGRLKDQAENITARQAADVVANSKEQRDKTVENAEKQYEDTVDNITYQRDVLGVISEEQAQKLIDEAELQKDGVVRNANNMHEDVVRSARDQAGEHVDDVNWETGEVLNGWDKMYGGVIDAVNWIRDLFGMDKLKKKGTVKLRYKHKGEKATGFRDVGKYAEGTHNGNRHPGGEAIVGEEGRELAHIPGKGLTMLGTKGPEFIKNLPAGSSVLPNPHTEALLSSYNFPPMYANGIGDYFDVITKGSKAVWKLAAEKMGFGDSLLPKTFKNAVGNVSGIIGGWSKNLIDDLIDDWGFGAGSFTGKVASNKQVEGWVKQALSVTNTPMSWLPAMMVKAQKESGYNPRAINLWDINAKRGIPSKGLFQTIDPTFNAHKMKGMNDIYNPIHNAVAAIRYIKSRYGSVFNTPGIAAMSQGGGYVGYEQGGFINKEHYAMVGEGNKKEVVIPLEQYRDRAKELWLQAGEKLGMIHMPQPDLPSAGYSRGGNTTSNTSNNNYNYNVYVAYTGNTKGNDIQELVKEIRYELERQDNDKNRAHGVI
ncbi:phage tail tape measure protein [Halobacillus sp. Marseille-P3879]|uniref:phage tail tape measure protein n=1 Tax=Halobacillus sp. Marseille-P3879 TaxID=2045014 RepID=UPI000C7D2142|nr:phage tail tape measure protein [Halobacillus sp. Marseille-P3879]